MHNVLEEMVYLDHIDRDTAIDIAKAVINENAIKLYKIQSNGNALH
ncbi:MAG: hypothetical protein JHC33_07650 [Ignisphaera sp.]|nr:hypothetical protein [Ignisphaera sp.]